MKDKNVVKMLENEFKDSCQTNNVICEYINSPFGMIKAKEPFNSNDRICEWCGGKDYIAICYDATSRSNAKTWLCLNLSCLIYKASSNDKRYQPTLKPKRCLEWAKFCEINDIGDLHYDVTFENIKQNAEKITILRAFVENPQGIIFMRGGTGRGKTYAAMGTCELFTRYDSSVAFTTQNNLSTKWENKDKLFISQLFSCSLLVVDDFGTGFIPNNFMKFFMDLINSRIQWKRKGTIITTNLNGDDLTLICGDALVDRLMSGQIFEFNGTHSRRY